MNAAPLSNPDEFLRTLVSLADTGTTEFGITLTVGGSLVTGTLTSTAKYLEAFSTAFSRGVDPHGTLDETLSKFTELHQAPSSAPSYIHLSDCRFFHGGEQPIPSIGSDGVWWRGRLTDVSGFTLGRVQFAPK